MLRLNVCVNFLGPGGFGSSDRCFWCCKTLITITEFGSGLAERPAPSVLCACVNAKWKRGVYVGICELSKTTVLVNSDNHVSPLFKLYFIGRFYLICVLWVCFGGTML